MNPSTRADSSGWLCWKCTFCVCLVPCAIVWTFAFWWFWMLKLRVDGQFVSYIRHLKPWFSVRILLRQLFMCQWLFWMLVHISLNLTHFEVSFHALVTLDMRLHCLDIASTHSLFWISLSKLTLHFVLKFDSRAPHNIYVGMNLETFYDVGVFIIFWQHMYTAVGDYVCSMFGEDGDLQILTKLRKSIAERWLALSSQSWLCIEWYGEPDANSLTSCHECSLVSRSD